MKSKESSGRIETLSEEEINKLKVRMKELKEQIGEIERRAETEKKPLITELKTIDESLTAYMDQVLNSEN